MKRLLALIILPVISGCALLGDIQIETPEERLVVLEYSYQAALKTVDRLVSTGIIKGEDAVRVAEIIEAASEGIKAARIAVFAQSSDAITFIVVANTLIFQLVEYLTIKEREEVSWLVFSPHYNYYQLS